VPGRARASTAGPAQSYPQQGLLGGGPGRLTFHGVHSLAEGAHPLTGAYRFDITFGRAL
jgi:alkylated DNA repair protein (DNA oxidative demethylase)